MTRPTTENGVKIALAALAKKSVRKACKEGGISVTTLYNKTTPKQREEAQAGKYVQEVPAAPKSAVGRPKSVKPTPALNSKTARRDTYVAKLERALLKRILISEE